MSDDLVFPRDTITAYATIKNQGTEPASSTSQLNVYFSKDATPDPGELLDSLTVSALDVNETGHYSLILTIPDIPDPADYGLWHVIFEADATDQILETDEANNTNIYAVTVTRPTIDVAVVNTTALFPTETLGFSYRICNPDNEDHVIGLGASIRPHGATDWMDDEPRDTTRTITPGCEWYGRDFVIRIDAPPGPYDLAWGLHNDLPGDTTFMYHYEEDVTGTAFSVKLWDMPLNSVRVFDSDGHERTEFYPGELISVYLNISNNSIPLNVTASLEVDDDANPGTPSMYDSHQQTPSEDVVLLPFSLGPGHDFVYRILLPESASPGQYYFAFGIHDEYYATMLKFIDWQPLFTVNPLSSVDKPVPEIVAHEIAERTPVPWMPVTSDGTAYNVVAYTSPENQAELDTLLDHHGLYGNQRDRQLVKDIVLLGPGGAPVDDPELGFELLLAANNIALHQSNGVLNAWEMRALDPDMILTTGIETQ